MKKLIFIALAFTVGIAFGAYQGKMPDDITKPDDMPGMINFQGLLRDPVTGNAYTNGIYTLDCRIYTSMSGKDAVWGTRYTAYVRDGYFNIMLGSTGTDLTDCAYSKASDLWKAMWFNGDLYLGVTPWQGSDGAPIDANDRKEITPRQQILAAPFAFRAQKAQYADGATEDFVVGGDLRVYGQILDGDDKSFGVKNVDSSDIELSLGASTTEPAKTRLQGAEVVIDSGSDMSINPGGNMTVTMGANKTFKVDGNNGFVMFEELSQLKGWADWIYFGWEAAGSGNYNYGLNIDKSAKKAELAAPTVSLKSRAIGSSTVKTSFSVSTTDISGEGTLKWKRPSYSNASPIIYRSVVFTLKKNTSLMRDSIADLVGSDVDASSYCWSVAGYAFVEGDLNETQWRSPELRQLRCRNGFLEVGVDAYSSRDRQFRIQLMGVNKQWCEDTRSEPDDDYTLYRD